MNTKKIITLDRQMIKILLFKTGDKEFMYVGEKVITLETIDIMIKNSLNLGFNKIKYQVAYGEKNIYFMLHQKYITIQEYKTSTKKSMNIYMKKQ